MPGARAATHDPAPGEESASDEGALRGDIVRLASRIRPATATDASRTCSASRAGGVNHKRVERIWRQDGLKVPQRQPKRGRLWLNDGSCIRLRPLYRGTSGRTTSWLEDARRRCAEATDSAGRAHEGVPGDRGGSQDRAHDVLEVLADLFVRHGASRVSEVGQRTGVHREARAAVVGARGRRDALYRAGQPVGERLQRELQRQAQGRAVERGDLLLVGGAAVLVEQWRREYNTVRPHSACGGFPPAPEAIKPSPWFPEDARPSRPSTGAGTNIECGTTLGGRSAARWSR